MSGVKRISLIMVGILCAVLLTGCNAYGDKTYGYFVTAKLRGGGITIVDLSALGKQQEVLIIPEKIAGEKVEGIIRYTLVGEADTGWESDKLKRVYFPLDIKIFHGTFHQNFAHLPKLEKIFFIENSNRNTLSDLSKNSYYCFYSSKYKYDLYYDGTYSAKFMKPANISYMYNYTDSPNAGYYWIDDVGYGNKIEIIPANPVRNGYKFDGWYKEAQCINKWNFDTDTLPNMITDENEEEVYQETILYAKWI